MDAVRLQDRISRGLGSAARRVGAPTDAYRPRGVSRPLERANRYLRLSAAFIPLDGKLTRPSAYASPLWQGIFDAAYTRPGDYLVHPSGRWFIAAQQPLLPVLCVQTDRTVSFARPSAPAGVGVNRYGGVSLSTATPLIDGWPASVLSVSGSGKPSADLPADGATGSWAVLLPPIPDVILRPADLMTDDLNRTGVVTTVELSYLGWRLTVKQAST